MSLEPPTRPRRADEGRDDTPSHLRERLPDPHRALPSSLESEQGVLCSFLLNPREVGALCAERGVTAETFNVPAHGSIYALLREMWEQARPVDIVTLTQALYDRNLLETCGGGAMISNLFTYLPTAMNVEHYIETMEEKRTLRQIIIQADRLSKRAYSDQDDAAGVVSDFAAVASTLGIAGQRKPVPTMREHVMDKMRRMEGNDVAKGFLKTGIDKLDQQSPLCLGSMPLICGERKSGKTMLANTIEANVARDGHRVLHFTLEDPASHTIDRLFAAVASVPIVKHRGDVMSERDFQQMSIAGTKLADWKFTIRDDIHDLVTMLAIIEQEKARYPDLALVVVDYAQLVRAMTRKQDSREQEVAKVSRALRLASIRLNVAMLVLSQVNKDGDARESQALEQDCTAKWLVEMTDDTNKRMVKVPIQRNGGSRLQFPLTFLGHLARFENYSGKEEEDAPAPSTGRKTSAKAWRGARD